MRCHHFPPQDPILSNARTRLQSFLSDFFGRYLLDLSKGSHKRLYGDSRRLYAVGMSTLSPINQGHAHFEGEASDALFRVQTALADLINAVPGPPQSPNELRKTLGIDKSLAWKVTKAVEECDPFGVVPFLPGEAGQKILLRAASSKGAPDEVVGAVRAALDSVDQVIKRHAGDRAAFELMLAGCRDLCQTRAAVMQRRESFHSNSLVWGVQAKVQYVAGFLRPSEQPGMADFARVRGFVDCRWIRHVPWTIARSVIFDDKGDVSKTAPAFEPLEPPPDGMKTHLLHEFCSQPLPRFERRVDPDGTIRDVFLDTTVGNTGSVTCFIGDVVRAIGPLVRDAENRFAAVVTRLATPSALLLLDVFVHNSLFDGRPPEFAVYGEMESRPWPASDEHQRLPLNVDVERTGRGASAASTRDVPRCADLARYVFKKTGWSEREFNLFRVRLEYPPLPVSAVMRYELPEKA